MNKSAKVVLSRIAKSRLTTHIPDITVFEGDLRDDLERDEERRERPAQCLGVDDGDGARHPDSRLRR